jgi:hypothetical protein
MFWIDGAAFFRLQAYDVTYFFKYSFFRGGD